MELEFRLRKNSMPDDMRTRGESIIQSIHGSLPITLEKYPNQEAIVLLKNQMNQLEFLLKLPSEITPLPPQEEIRSQLAQYLSTFDPSVQEFITTNIQEIYRETQLAIESNQRSNHKKVFYFHGAAGTGKSATARFIPKILDIPYCEIKLSGLEPKLLSGKDEGKYTENTISSITKCLTRSKSRTKKRVLHIDEVHDVLNQKSNESAIIAGILKGILEPNQDTFHDDGLDLDIDTSELIIILSANEEADESSNTNAFRSRLNTLYFPKLTDTNRITVAQDTAQNWAQQNKYALTPEDNEMTVSLAAMDPNDGARVLKKVIEEYLSYQIHKTDNWLEKPSVFDAKASFRRHGSVEFQKTSAVQSKAVENADPDFTQWWKKIW